MPYSWHSALRRFVVTCSSSLQLDLFNQRRIIRVGLRVVDPLLTFLSVPCSTSDGATRFSLPRFFSQCSPGFCFGCSTIIYPRRRSARRRQSILTQSVPSVPPIECSHGTKEREVAKDPTSEGDQRPQHRATRHDIPPHYTNGGGSKDIDVGAGGHATLALLALTKHGFVLIMFS